MYSTSEITEIYNRNIDMVYRICFMYTKNKFDAEDMAQNVFLRLLKRNVRFTNAEHERAWFIRCAVNQCKDLLKSSWRKVMLFTKDDRQAELMAVVEPSFIDETLDRVLALPNKYKTVLYLYYYEGYKADEIARLLKKPAGTVRSQLLRGRNMLKEKLNEASQEESAEKSEGGNKYEYKAIF